MNTDDFADGDAAIEYAHEHISETPLDELTEAAIRDELSMLEAVLEWEKPRHDRTITARQAALETALEHDHFDAREHDRGGSRYLDQRGNLVVLDGVHWVNEAVITHYHYVIVNRQTGEIDRPMEARETLPGDGETHWLAVEELDEHLADGLLRPAEVLPRDETLVGLLGSGLSPAEAVDYWGTTVLGHTQEEWSDKRGVGQGSVGENVSKARNALEE
jgi:hypothetical protein